MSKVSNVGKAIPNIDESTIATVECSNCFKDMEVNFIQYLTEVQMQGKSHSVICKKCRNKKRRAKMSNMVEHAKRELDLILNKCTTEEDREYQQLMNDGILEIVKVFAEQDHSEFSANYSIHILEKLLRQSFITPLTGEDDEWNEVGHGVFQNRRESAIFKQASRFEGQAYYLDGKAFSDNGGKTWYTNKNSFVTVEFPLFKLPETERILVDVNENE